jgi:hypothetical protein
MLSASHPAAATSERTCRIGRFVPCVDVKAHTTASTERNVTERYERNAFLQTDTD